jgi:ATP-binding cassette subfamily B protein
MSNPRDSQLIEKRSDISNFKLLWKFISPDRQLFLVAITIILVNLLITAIAPFSLQLALEKIETSLNLNSPFPKEIVTFGFIYGSLVILSYFVRATQLVTTAKLSARTISRLREDVFEKILKNNMAFFNNLQVGQVVSKVTSDSNELISIGDRLAYITSNFLVLIVISILMMTYSVELTFYALVSLPFASIIVYNVAKRVRKFSAIWRHQFGLVNASFNETFSAIQISKAFGREKENISRFMKLNEATFEASKKRGFYIFINPPIMDFFRHLIVILLLVGGSIAVFDGRLQITTIFLFFVLLDYFYGPVVQLSNNFHQFQSGFANLDRMLSIIASNEEQEIFGLGKDASHLNGQIDFVDVNFAYTKDNFVLKNVNLNIKSGERIALVGHTGAGKTTFISLLMMFYKLNKRTGSSGQILLDNIPIQEYELNSLRQTIGLVSQNIFLFSGTIRDNMLIAKPHATDEEIWKALTLANAHGFVARLSGNLDYDIGERASRLSIGERQLLSIARVLLADPKIIILDEATSSVDLYTEALIQEAFETVLKSRTSIVIAHRLTTIKKADRIVVLEAGKIIEIGSHDFLMQQKGKYYEIYDTYFKHQSIEFLSGKVN